MNDVVLLTGATGFVGSQVLRRLAENGSRVRLVVREDSDIPKAYQANIEKVILTTNLFDETADWWSETCNGVDKVIHVAWYAEPGKYLQSSKNIECLTGTLNLAQGATSAGVRRFVGIGTCFEYDVTHGQLSVDTPIKPSTLYAGTKAAAYFTLSQLFSKEQVGFSWARLFYLYGEGEDSRRLVPYVRSKLSAGEEVELTSGDQTRDFMDVIDAGNMIADLAMNDSDGAVNICSGIPITVRQLVENIADEYGRRDLLKFGVRPDNLFDPPCVVGIK